MHHKNASHGHCSIPLLIGQIWLPNSAVFNFVTRLQWLKIVHSIWRSSGAIFVATSLIREVATMSSSV